MRTVTFCNVARSLSWLPLKGNHGLRLWALPNRDVEKAACTGVVSQNKH
ncbi:MAG TPA: hypothetical protein V6D50_04135 [Chroococcales cyanobacterium]